MKQTVLAAKRQVTLNRIADASKTIADRFGLEDYASIAAVPGNLAVELQQLRMLENAADFLEAVAQATPAQAAPRHAGVTVDDLTQIKGVGPETAWALVVSGYGTFNQVAKAPAEELTAIPGIGEKSAAGIKKDAKALSKGA